jgi:hypothetical protein
LPDQHGRRRAQLLRPFGRAGDQFAILVAGGDVENGDRRQRIGTGQRLAALLEKAFLLQRPQEILQFDAGVALQPESLGDLPLRPLVRVFGDELSSSTSRGGTAPWMITGFSVAEAV